MKKINKSMQEVLARVEKEEATKEDMRELMMYFIKQYKSMYALDTTSNDACKYNAIIVNVTSKENNKTTRLVEYWLKRDSVDVRLSNKTFDLLSDEFKAKKLSKKRDSKSVINLSFKDVLKFESELMKIV